MDIHKRYRALDPILWYYCSQSHVDQVMQTAQDQSFLVPEKGDLRHTLHGYEFNIRENRWEIPGEGRTYSFNLDTISQVCEPSLGHSIREGLADLLMAAAPSTVRSSLHAMNRLLRYCNGDAQDRIPLKEIGGELLEAYLFSKGVAADRSLKPLLQTFIDWNRVGLLACGWLASLVPAWRAYRQSLADGLSIRL